MKAILCLALAVVVATAPGFSQVTQINNNDGLDVLGYLNNTKVFLVDKNDHLWISNATKAGTTPLSTTITVQGDAILFNNVLFFVGSTPQTGNELFVSDGTPAGTKLLVDLVSGATGSDPGNSLIPMGGSVYFTAATPASGRELWRTNGTAAGTSIVKDIRAGALSGIPPDDQDFDIISAGSYLLLTADDGSGKGLELWRSNGSAAGTFLLKDVSPGAVSSTPGWFYPYKNEVLFIATTPAEGREIWKTDGTAAGTTILKDILPGTGSSTVFTGFGIPLNIFYSSYHEFKGELYFRVIDGPNFTLYKTNGTTAGTIPVKALVPATQAWIIDIFSFWNLSDRFIFVMGDAQTRAELWECNGTGAGTKVIFSFSEPQNSIPIIFPNFYFDATTAGISYQLYKGHFFLAAAGGDGDELWWSNGTAAGTTQIKDIFPGDNGIQNNVSYLYTSGGLYFAAQDAQNGNELWISDGTATGTKMVKDINPGGDSDPQVGLFVNNLIMFTATDGDDQNFRDLFVIGGEFGPLPLNLLFFRASAQDGKVFLDWATEQERQTKNYVIEVSADTKTWNVVGEVAAAGMSTGQKKYFYVDEQAGQRGATTLYYRLKMNDLDGAFSYSSIESVKLPEAGFSVNLLGNPVKGRLQIALSGLNGVTRFTITDISGRRLYVHESSAAAGVFEIPVQLPRGSYVLSVENGKNKRQIRFVQD